MGKFICPCCGQSFNGKKCRNCYYETFDDEISRVLHTHAEVNVPDGPAARPAPVQRNLRRNREQRRNPKTFPKWLIWVLVFSLLEPALVIAGEIIDSISDGFTTSFVTTAAPEPDAVVPENAELLLSADGFQLFIGASEDGLNYPLFLANTSDVDVRLSSRQILIDGFLSTMSGAWCEAPAGTVREGELWLDAKDLTWAVMEKPSRIEGTFAIYDAEKYEDILELDGVILDGTPQILPAPAGDVLVDREEILVSCLGYQADAYDPDAFHQGSMLFYIENRTGDPLTLYSEEAKINGQEIYYSIWAELPGNTRTVCRMWLYDAAELGIEKTYQAENLELLLTAYNESEIFELGWFTVIP